MSVPTQAEARVFEPVNLSVSDIVREVAGAAAASSAAPGAEGWSTSLTGTLFHEIAAELLRGGDGASWQRVLDRDTVADTALLTRHVYQVLLGPKLLQHRAALQGNTRAVLSLWVATRELCKLLCELLSAAQERGLIRYSPERLCWEGTESLFLTETALEWVFRRERFRAPVRIRGVADAIWFHPVDRSWCVLELKTSRRSREAELSQACLYHRMITETLPGGPEQSAIALVYFRPELEAVTFTAGEIADAQMRLEVLAGRLAGVLTEPEGPAALAHPIARVQVDGHHDLAQRVVSVLRQYGCDVSLAGPPIVGPTFLRVRLLPGRGVKVKPIQDQASSLQVQLRLESPPIIYVANGDLVVDMQRPDRATVLFSDLRSSLPAPDPLLGNARVMLGVDLFGNVRYVDLRDDNTAHILVAGTPGSGKSEWLRVALASLLLTNTPDTLRLALIDPKRTAFADLRNSPFLWNERALMLPPEASVENLLDELIEEMEQRYRWMEQHGVDKITDLAVAANRPIPRLVCVCDEFADVLQMDRKQGKEIEQRIVRLGAKARAAGIHLILATQHPNRDVISGALKTTLGGRICLRTTSHVQSALMSTPNAEKLLGRGDLLYLDVGQPVRLQAPLLPPAERRRIFTSSGRLVDGGGIEPPTSALRTQRSPS